MTTIADTPFQSTWRALGLSVAVAYSGLGCLGIFAPKMCAEGLGLRSHNNPEAERLVANSLILLSARDLSIATALYSFYRTQNSRAMGTVILSTMVLCVIDVAMVWRLKRDSTAALLAVPAAVTGWIGIKLLES